MIFLFVICSFETTSGIIYEYFPAKTHDNIIFDDSNTFCRVNAAGKPRLVPFKNIVNKSGLPQCTKSNQQFRIAIPGQDNTLLPDEYLSREAELSFDYPIPVIASKPEFRDDANRDIRCYGNDQGFAGGYTGHISQDKEKRIWFASNKLICFDGSLFTNYHRLHFGGTSFSLNTRAFTIDNN